MDPNVSAAVVVIASLFLLLLAILWILLPFAVFGIKERMDQQHATINKLVKLVDQNNALLRQPLTTTDLPVRNDPPSPKP